MLVATLSDPGRCNKPVIFVSQTVRRTLSLNSRQIGTGHTRALKVKHMCASYYFLKNIVSR